jgi:LCP family protein required for cell wall assembly
VYRGGRVRPNRGALPRPGAKRRGGVNVTYHGDSAPPPKKRRRLRWLRWIPVAVLVLLVLVVVWGVAGYFKFRDGVNDANDRIGKPVVAALDKQSGLLWSKPSDILLLGTDHATFGGRESAHRSDSITLLRSDPDKHRFTYLSIPRDLRVPIPGHGESKINAAFQLGGAKLAIKTVRNLTGLPIHHVVIVDFAQFRELIDAVGGIDIVVPEKIVSKFDCPYDARRCATWPGWRFAKGKQHMDGRRALIYSRIRENKLNPADTDFSRAEHNQQVLQATLHKLASFWTFVKLPFVGNDLLKSVSTDLDAGQLLSLGWVKWRTGDGRALHCRLGGEPSGGEIIGEPENQSVIKMVVGESAPQPPLPGSGPFGAGCVVGNRTLGVR